VCLQNNKQNASELRSIIHRRRPRLQIRLLYFLIRASAQSLLIYSNNLNSIKASLWPSMPQPTCSKCKNCSPCGTCGGWRKRCCCISFFMSIPLLPAKKEGDLDLFRCLKCSTAPQDISMVKSLTGSPCSI
jgi:hypothetical protein